MINFHAFLYLLFDFRCDCMLENQDLIFDAWIKQKAVELGCTCGFKQGYVDFLYGINNQFGFKVRTTFLSKHVTNFLTRVIFQ